jgi:hypothetical protein
LRTEESPNATAGRTAERSTATGIAEKIDEMPTGTARKTAEKLTGTVIAAKIGERRTVTEEKTGEKPTATVRKTGPARKANLPAKAGANRICIRLE